MSAYVQVKESRSSPVTLLLTDDETCSSYGLRLWRPYHERRGCESVFHTGHFAAAAQVDIGRGTNSACIPRNDA
jgi:hypothetical protein